MLHATPVVTSDGVLTFRDCARNVRFPQTPGIFFPRSLHGSFPVEGSLYEARAMLSALSCSCFPGRASAFGPMWSIQDSLGQMPSGEHAPCKTGPDSGLDYQVRALQPSQVVAPTRRRGRC